MEAEVWIVIGLTLLILFVSFILTLPNFTVSEQASVFRKFYEKYVDVLVISLTAAAGLFAVAFSLGILLQGGTFKDLYIFAALVLLTIKNVLLFIDVASNTPQKWLVSSVAHLMDLGIMVFLYLAVRERS